MLQTQLNQQPMIHSENHKTVKNLKQRCGTEKGNFEDGKVATRTDIFQVLEVHVP